MVTGNDIIIDHPLRHMSHVSISRHHNAGAADGDVRSGLLLGRVDRVLHWAFTYIVGPMIWIHHSQGVQGTSRTLQ